MCLLAQLSAFAQNKLFNPVFTECATAEMPYKCTNDKLKNDVLDLIDQDIINSLPETSKPYFSISVVFITDANGGVIKEHTQIKTPSYLLNKRIQNYLANLPAFTPKDSSVEEKRSAFFINFTLLRNDVSKMYYVAENTDFKERNIKPDYIGPDDEALYPGCKKSDDQGAGKGCSIEKMYNFVTKNFKIPEVDSTLQIKMIANFYFDTTGKIQVESIEGGDESFQWGLRNAMNKLPNFTPAMIKGIPVVVGYKLPITLNLK